MKHLIKVGVVVISFLLGTIAWSANSVTVQTLTVDPGASSVTVGVFIENDVALSGMQVPLEFREVNAGSYIVNSLTHNVQGRVAASGIIELPVEVYYPDPDPGNPCSGPVSQSYSVEGAIDFVSPDAHVWAGVRITGPCLPPGSDGNTPSFVFTFDVTNTVGSFEIDTCCVVGSAHLLFIDCNGQQVAPSFTKGVVTIAPTFDHKMHYPQLPDPSGWDVNCTGNVELPNSIMLADDFRCSETGYIDDIHFWGSWKDNLEGQVIMFHLAIHDNVAEGPHGYSEPGEELWWIEIYEPEFTVTPEDPSGEQGWYDPINGDILPQNHSDYYRYDVIFPPGSGFWQEQGQIYWLKISAFIADPENTAWGWKTSISPLFMDDAVYDSYAEPTGWRELYEPMPEPPIVNDWWVAFGPGGELMDGWGSDAYGEGWYYYPSTNWWNIWFYDHPLVPGRKHIHVEFDAFGPGTQTGVFAVNWSTDQWDMPDEPPLPGVDENLYIGRAEFPIVEGRNVFDWDIPTYNPEWVSIDFQVFDLMDIPWGIIDHQCIPSLDLAFCITGEGGAETSACCWTDGSCTMEIQSYCEDNGGVFYPDQTCAEVVCPVENPVYDLWETPDGYNTYVDFGCGESTPAIPADFFGPGSDPFDGIIALVGEPLPTTGDLGPTDTVIKRFRPAELPDCPSQDQIELEIVALSLVSTAPITVTYGGQNPEEWDVTVCLSESREQPTGIMNIYQVCQEGGTFNAYVPVVPNVIFTRVSDGVEYNIDYGEWGIPAIELYAEEGHWMFSDPGFGVYTSAVGDLVSNCDDIPDIPIGPSAVDLIPGLQAIPCIDCSQPAADYDIPITSLLEPSAPVACAQHDVWPPHDVVEDIPTLTEWGMILLGLLLLTAGTIAIVRKRKAAVARTN